MDRWALDAQMKNRIPILRLAEARMTKNQASAKSVPENNNAMQSAYLKSIICAQKLHRSKRIGGNFSRNS